MLYSPDQTQCQKEIKEYKKELNKNSCNSEILTQFVINLLQQLNYEGMKIQNHELFELYQNLGNCSLKIDVDEIIYDVIYSTQFFSPTSSKQVNVVKKLLNFA
jgi:mRNA-degrading endonuclease YafQ of YafQ-DinJ toxin-antitoxin module